MCDFKLCLLNCKSADTDLAALEVTPGLLLRITTQTGEKYFYSAAVVLDPVGTAGHLVSMVAADGIVNAPMALLANHMQNSLAAAVAKEGRCCSRNISEQGNIHIVE